MQPKARLVLVLLLLTVISFIDHQFFYEPRQVTTLSALQRQVMHLLVLLCFIPIGLIALKGDKIHWMKKLWVTVYASAISLLAVIGVIQWKLHAFPSGVLDIISTVRIFITSPLPFLLLYFMARKFYTESPVTNH